MAWFKILLFSLYELKIWSKNSGETEGLSALQTLQFSFAGKLLL